MARLELIAMLVKATGKVFGRKCDMWLMERYGTKYTAHSNHPRDYKKNPQSKAEKVPCPFYCRNFHNLTQI